MAGINDAWAEHRRRRWMRPNAHLYIRPDAHRFMPAGAPRYLGQEAVRYFWPEVESEQHDTNGQKFAPSTELDLAAERQTLLRLKSELATLKAELKLRRVLRAFKAGFNPGQPRDDRGRWTDDGQRTGDDEGQTGDDGAESEAPVRLAGDIPTNEPPEIPKERPATERERNRIARDVSRNPRLRGWLGLVLGGAGHWLNEKLPEIAADQDSPRTLDELQERALSPRKGYDVHHIVEQGSARVDGYPEEMINASENRVLVPRYQHWRINGWLGERNENYGGMSPRDYLMGKSWEERRRVGLNALADFGVLKR